MFGRRESRQVLILPWGKTWKSRLPEVDRPFPCPHDRASGSFYHCKGKISQSFGRSVPVPLSQKKNLEVRSFRLFTVHAFLHFI
jgi:hypothetical protein